MTQTEPRAANEDEVVPPLPAGEWLAPDYEVVEHLSRGRVLDVYDVWSEERACRCVAKVLRPDRLEDRKWKNRLLREGRILKRLTHLHLVRAYEVLQEPRLIVILETLTGDTVECIISTQGLRRMPVGDIVYLGLHLCSAIPYLHRQGILHLDLKPSNVISNLGVAKVLDLSIARPPGRVRGGAGTRQYMAPEQARGGLVSPKADVWGIGVVLFEATTGRRPFEALEGKRYQQLERRADLVRAHRRAPAALATVIDRCLEPEPEKRPTVDELADVLDSLALEL